MLFQHQWVAIHSRPRRWLQCVLTYNALVLGCFLLVLLGSEGSVAQRRGDPPGVAPSAISPNLGKDTPDRTIQFQQMDKKPVKFSSRAYFILVPAIVTDNDGKHISGLTKDKFQIFEDGKEQIVASVDEVQTSAVPLQRVAASPNAFSNAITLDGGARRINVIALDLINTPFLDQIGSRQAAIKYLTKSINQDAVFELVSIDGNGMHVLHDFTTDTEGLIAALKKVTSKLDAMAGTDTSTIRQATANPGLEQHNGLAVIYTVPTSFRSAASADGLATVVDRDSTALEAFARGATPIAEFAQVGAVASTLGAFQQIAQQLAGIPGRKSLFWITGSFPFDIDNTGSSVSVGTPFDAYQRTMQLLNSANISLYPVDARGLVVAGEIDASMKVSREAMRSLPEYMAGESQAHQKTLDTMRIFADTTGGKAYINTNDLVRALSDAASDGSSYYMLSYALDTKNNRPGWRKLRVRLRDGDYHVRSREGFFVTPTTMDPANSESIDIREALTSPLDYTGVPLSVKLDAPVTHGVKRKVLFSLLVPPNAATVDASDNDRLNLEIWYVVRNVKGEDVSHNSKLYNLNLNATYLAQLQTSGIGYSDTLELPPGQYGLRVVVRDNITGRVGSVWAPLQVD
jgi:VWFA-related protein